MKSIRKLFALLIAASMITLSVYPAMAEETNEEIVIAEISPVLEQNEGPCGEQPSELIESQAAEVQLKEEEPEEVQPEKTLSEEEQTVDEDSEEPQPEVEQYIDEQSEETIPEEGKCEGEQSEGTLPEEEQPEDRQSEEPQSEEEQLIDEPSENEHSEERQPKEEQHEEKQVEEKPIDRDAPVYVIIHTETIDGVVRTIIESVNPLGNTQITIRELANSDLPAGEQVIKITAGLMLDLAGRVLPPGTTAIVYDDVQELVEKLYEEGAIEDPFVEMGHPWQEQVVQGAIREAASKIEEFNHSVSTAIQLLPHLPDLLFDFFFG